MGLDDQGIGMKTLLVVLGAVVSVSDPSRRFVNRLIPIT